jgi:hypothetical protein
MPLRMIGIEKKLAVEGGDQRHIRLHPTLKTFQGGKRRQPIVAGSGKCFLKSVITRHDRCRTGDLLISLLDQTDKNAPAGPEARFNLSEGVVAVGMANKKISGPLQQCQERDQKEKQPAAKSAKTKFQG